MVDTKKMKLKKSRMRPKKQHVDWSPGGGTVAATNNHAALGRLFLFNALFLVSTTHGPQGPTED